VGVPQSDCWGRAFVASSAQGFAALPSPSFPRQSLTQQFASTLYIILQT